MEEHSYTAGPQAILTQYMAEEGRNNGGAQLYSRPQAILTQYMAEEGRNNGGAQLYSRTPSHTDTVHG